MRKFQLDAWAIFIAVILIIASLWVLLQHIQQRSEIRHLDPFALVPSDAWLVLDLKDPQEITSFFLTDTLTWKELRAFREVDGFTGRLRMLDSLSGVSPDFQAALKNARVVVSVHNANRGESPVLVQVRFNPEIRLPPFQRMLERTWEQQSGDKAYDFLGASVYEWKPKEGSSFFAAFYKGSLLLSFGKRLIEHAITQDIAGSALVTSAELNEIRAVAGKRASNVFFDGSRLCEALERLYLQDPLSLVPCEDFSGWMGWDLALLGDEVRLTGFAHSGRDSSAFLHLLSGQSPSDPFLMKFIPSASASFTILNFDQTPALNETLSEFLAGAGRESSVDSATRNRLKPFLGNSMASVLLYIPDSPARESILTLIHVRDPRGLREKMQDPEQWGLLEESMIPVDTVFGEVIWKFVPEGLVPSLSLQLLPSEKPFVAFQDSVLLAGANPPVVKQALMQIHYRQVISNESRLSEDFIFQQPASNLLFMVNIPYFSDMIQESWQPGISRLIGEVGEGVFPFDRLTAQFSSHREGLFFSNVSLYSLGAELTGTHRPLWEVRLDTLAYTQPMGVINHVDGSRELLVQDLNGNLYLVDRFGKVLWKKQVSGLINSPVFQVDRYDNGKLQYLFSTPSHLHLMDRNGNDVEGYPIRFRVSALHGITVVDYDGDHDYRILFEGGDRRIYNLGLDGKRTSGWELPKLEDPGAAPPQYLKLGSRDYLLVIDQKGKPYFLDRRGQARLDVPKAFRLSASNPVFPLKRDDNYYFVALGPEGSVLQMDEQAHVESFMLDSMTRATGFLLLDRGNEKDPAYVFSGEGNLRAFDRLGTILFSQTLPGPPSLPLSIIKAGGKTFFAMNIADEGLLYLFDQEGNLVSPFPLQGEKGLVLESLMQDQSWNLVTVKDDRLVAYLLGEL